jgi:membrane-bound lytic murein transglycosylase D
MNVEEELTKGIIVNKKPILHGVGLLLFVILTVSGCQTVPQPTTLAAEIPAVVEEVEVGEAGEVFQFEPIRVPQIADQPLEPIAPRNALELLEEAMTAFDEANAAQEAGDKETAYLRYTQMMELLLESDLDPTVFYSLRDQFNSILDSTTKLARHYDRTKPEEWTEDVIEFAFRSELEYPNPLNDRVLAEIRHIQKSYPSNFQRGLDRSQKYLPYIREEFEKAGLPEDLVWLAMVESQFTPRINSRVGAGGMWQFMRSTGVRYGLTSDGFVDDRYDWKEATQASIKYLTELYEMFESWPLAVSSYNMGEAGVERVIAMNRGDRNWWNLMETPPAANRIPRETKKFYPKLLASAIIANNPEQYGFKINKLQAEETEVVKVNGAYSLQDIAQTVGISRETLQKYNQHLLNGHTSPNRTTNVYVPVGKERTLVAALPKLPKLRPDSHRVRQGETLSEIASLYKVKVRDLMNSNRIKSARHLQIGQRLVIPGRVGASPRSVAKANGPRKVYTVKSGDSLSRIASRNRISVANLQRWNNMGAGTRIHVGDRLYISQQGTGSTPTAIASKPSSSTKVTKYTVKRGDFLEKIAKNHAVSLNDVLRWNNLTKRSTIRVGDEIKLYLPSLSEPKNSPSTVALRSEGNKVTHKVKSGESISTIAMRHGVNTNDIYKWNKLNSRSVLQVGQSITVYKSEPKTTSKTAVLTMAHVVRSGDNPSDIAKKYKIKLRDLYALNGWKKDPVLQIGQKVKIMN